MYRLITAAMFGVGVLGLLAVTIALAGPDDERRERAETLNHREHRPREVDELHRHLLELRAKQEALARTDDTDARKHVEDEIGAVEHEIAQIEEGLRGGRSGGPDDRHRELGELHRHLEELLAKQEELARTDDIDARHRVDEQIEATKREIGQFEERLAREHPEHDHDRPHHPEEGEEFVRRIEHLHVAAENLAQAGELDLAHELHARAEDMERELHRRREHNEAEHRGNEHAELREIHAAIHELREEVEQLRDQVNELRSIVERGD